MSSITSITDSTFEITVSRGVTLVDFWAPWCGPCKALSPVLERVAKEFGDKARIVKMDIGANPDIPGILGITSIPALVLFKDGQRLDQRGTQTAPQIQAWIEAALS